MVKKIIVLLVTCLLVMTQSVGALTNPTHFVDTQWNLFDVNGYSSIEVDITPQVEESPSTDGYYFANTVYFRNYTGTNFGGAYAGLQTNGYSGSSWIGKMALFSVWDVSSGIAEAGGWGSTFGGEGTGYSVRLKYNWVTGRTYRLKIYIDQDATNGNRLWGASLTDTYTGTVTRIGRIYVPTERGKIYGPVTFHERYLGPVDACSSVKKSQVTFTNMTANSGAVKASSWNNYFIAKTPECPNLAWLTTLDNGIQSGIATTKPVVAPTQAPPPVTKPSPAPTKTPIVSIVPKVPDVSKPTELIQPEIKEVTGQITEKPTSTLISNPTKRSVAPIIVIGTAIIIGTFLVVNGVLFLKNRRYRIKATKYLAKHFPYDPDLK